MQQLYEVQLHSVLIYRPVGTDFPVELLVLVRTINFSGAFSAHVEQAEVRDEEHHGFVVVFGGLEAARGTHDDAVQVIQ